MKKKLFDLFARYCILILVAIPGLFLFYKVFAPLTIYPVYWLFNLFFEAFLRENFIMVNGIILEIISACVAGSAYYLLLILNLAVPNIKLRKRIKMILFAFIIFLIINILRIFFLGILAFSDPSLFDITHKIFWYVISILFVVGIWFLEVKVFKIKHIPFYSDLKFLYKKIKC